MYIPFEQVTITLLHELVMRGYKDFVLQRFEWPSVIKGKGFMLSAYADRQQAQEHAAQLGAKEGKVVSLPEDASKITDLLHLDSGYRVFLNKIREEDWNKRMLKWYQKNIVYYLQTKTRFKRADALQILFTFEHGRVWAEISNGPVKKKVSAIELIG